MPRIITYNVHRCLGVDGVLDPRRIAAVIAACQPDIVALQELDVRRARSGGVDQAQVIADELGMQMHFHPALRVMEEMYGDAILTARPSRFVKGGALPERTGAEPRGALWAAVQLPGGEVQVINTHLGLRGLERLRQIEALLGPEWLGHPKCSAPAILLGDFNAVPQSRAYRRVAARLRDAQGSRLVARAQPTFPGRLPVLRIDHVFVSAGVEVTRAEPVRTPLSRKASDHLPLLVEFRLTRPSAPGARLEDTVAD
ncbi:endonuclease [Alsobacter soli]|uniref:Endonuclease n=1 Tax=Alsobacter soli TaxID=2109933 RepID=A0A2T1HQU0_9HYPH|nr:endonuclease/exonuclease/phosphatase family protein [Alsobacter soli]PSC04018.1 endonuclease [Alsobacter soli]